MILEKLKLLAMLIFISLLFPSLVFCHGWAGYEQGAKAHGMGCAFTGLADDPTAVFYNLQESFNLMGPNYHWVLPP